jgi:hypothetical protein
VKALAVAIALAAVAILTTGMRLTGATFNAATNNPGTSVAAARIFPANRSLSPRDVRDASNGAEANKSDPLSFADAIVDTTATGINSGTNRYAEFTMNSARPAGISVSGAQFNFRLASKGGPGSGNACFWFDVRSGASVIGTHGSYASSVGCSTGNTQATFSTALPEVTTTDQVNGLVIRAYVWETAAKQVNVDMATVTGATPYTPSFTAYEHQAADGTSGTLVSAVWSLATPDTSLYTSAGTWISGAPSPTEYLKFTFDPSVPTGSTLASATFTHVWHPVSAVTNGGTLCYYFETLDGTTSLANHGSGASPVSCNALASNVTDTVSLPEVNTASRASNLVIKVYYWGSPQCGGAGKPGCVKTVTDQAQLTLNYSLL